MSTPHRAPTVAARDFPASLAALRARGLRISAARRRVLEALFAAPGPVSAEAIAAGRGGQVKGGDLASVYRNLETLESIGLVRHVHLGHGPGLYALATRWEDGYAACERCGRHATVDSGTLADMRRAVREACGFEAAFEHFAIVGLCPDCAARLDAG